MTRRVPIAGGLWTPGEDEADVFDDQQDKWVKMKVIECEDCGRLGVSQPCSECAPPEPGRYTKRCAHCYREFTTEVVTDRYCCLGCTDLRRRLMDGTVESISHGRPDGWNQDERLR